MKGTLLEKYLTASPEDFEALLRKNPPADRPVDTRREAYRYAKVTSRSPSLTKHTDASHIVWKLRHAISVGLL